jgi:hypothetical protein
MLLIYLIHGLKVILHSILDNFVRETKFHGVEFSTVTSRWHSKSLVFWSISDFGFFGLEMPTL